MITDVDDYFVDGCGRCGRFATPDCSTRIWADGLHDLRAICLGAGLSETVKWGHPCYMLGDRNIALIGAFRGDFRLTFFNAALMKDPEKLLEKPGPNTQTPCLIRFTDPTQVTALAPVIRSYLAEATSYAEAGILPRKTEASFDLPDELVEVLAADPDLASAFDALTPGRQRSYVINLTSAKKSATRFARIDRFRNKILAGKGANER
ncbi:OmdA-family protein [Aliiroseovarius zhejiangensis]|uniref:OmdA-family protein n=1 Tax=Aliiroseovarius zhejiangensis TaxID=1632025 RepID=A0ABQ3IVT8_9RHOB|nr:YdeI/OmpD-associated family protein [Aliiroseovarius zhejiangensis]GHE90729.1 OmdA-family protein [Aliiroseovarius zhejiangensis]